MLALFLVQNGFEDGGASQDVVRMTHVVDGVKFGNEDAVVPSQCVGERKGSDAIEGAWGGIGRKILDFAPGLFVRSKVRFEDESWSSDEVL